MRADLESGGDHTTGSQDWETTGSYHYHQNQNVTAFLINGYDRFPCVNSTGHGIPRLNVISGRACEGVSG